MNELKRIIKSFVVENFLFGEPDGLEDSTSFLEEGIVDSTGVLELVAFIEETFEVIVEDEELIPDNLDSIAKVAQYIHGKGR